MVTMIYDIQLGMNHCYLIREKGLIMVDAGVPKKISQFTKQIDKLGVKPNDIKLIVVTHAHFDHVGSLAEIVELTGAKVAVHELDRHNLENGISELPKGNSRWGRISLKLLKPMLKDVEIPGVVPDIVIKENEYPLAEFGINGKILFTPGHTKGSLSVLLDNGEAFVGCMAHNMFPFTVRPRTPIFADYPEELNQSWKLLMSKNVKTIYPGHGKAFSADKMEKFILD